MHRGILGLVLVVFVAGGAMAEKVAESLRELERRTRDYQASLERLLALQEEQAARADASAERYRQLLRDGLISRRDVETVEQTANEARGQVEETRTRLAQSEVVLQEAEAAAQIAMLPPARVGEERVTADALQYAGPTAMTLDQLATISDFFEEQFGRPLPVSALGQTAVHDRLGFDHRHAIDVALHPDSIEGRALRAHLRAQGVPYLAFRGAVAGISTGAHIHIGPPSRRTR